MEVRHRYKSSVLNEGGARHLRLRMFAAGAAARTPFGGAEKTSVPVADGSPHRLTPAQIRQRPCLAGLRLWAGAHAAM